MNGMMNRNQMVSKQLQFEVTKEGLNTVPRWQKLAFLFEVKIKVLQRAPLQICNINLTSSDLQGGSQISGCHNPNIARASPETKGRMDEMMMSKDELPNVNAKERPKQASLVNELDTALGR